MTSAARARIRLGAIRKNFDLIKNSSQGARVMAVVKANAYGHGIVQVCRALTDAQCFAVARLSEARVLRDAGIDAPIVLLGGVGSVDDLIEALKLNLQVCVHCEPQIGWLEKFSGANANVWIKVDTGMNRLGLRIGDVPGVLDRLRNCDAVGEVALMTHLANADDIEDDTTSRQIEAFARVVEGFAGHISIANSAGIFGWPSIHKTFSDFLQQGRLWVRPGISLYGISPLQKRSGGALGLQPAMQLESQLMDIKLLKSGERVGYGGTWQSSVATKIGVVSIGYADGYVYSMPSGSTLLLNGRQVSLIGRVSMDLVTVDLGSDSADQIGDTVVLWGDELPVENVAEFADTIPYSLVSGVSERVERIYDH